MSPDSRDWYVLKHLGPPEGLPLMDVERLVADGKLKQNDLVSRRGWDRWRPVAEVDALSASSSQPNSAGSNPTKFKDRLLHELTSYAGIAVYLWIILLLLRLHESVILQQYGLTPQGEHPLIVHALIIGKVILLVEMLRIGNRVEWRIPAANILAKSVFFALCLLTFTVLEHSIMSLWKGEAISDALAEENTLAKIVTVIAIMTIAFIPYHYLKETQRTSDGPKLFDYLFDRNGSG